MKKINNRKFTLNLLMISIVSGLLVCLFVKFILSNNDLALFMVRFIFMIITALMILTFIIFIILFLVRLVLKKKNCFGRPLSIISAITIILVMSTAIIVKEDSKYYHTVNRNWQINLPKEYEEIYYKDSGASFHGDGERYSVFQYKNLDQINNVLEWKTRDDDINLYPTKILEKLQVSTEYYPDFNDDFKYFYKIKDDKSELYIILNSNLKKIYIVENIL